MRGDHGARISLTAVLIIVVVIVASILGPLAFLKVREVTIDEERSVEANGSGRVDLKLQASLGEVSVVFLPLDGDAVRITSTLRGRSTVFGEGSPFRMTLGSENGTDDRGEVQRITAVLDTYAPWPTYSLKRVNYTVAVDQSLRAHVNVSVVTGGIALSTSPGTVLEGLELNATVHGVAVSLNNGTVLAGDVRLRTATGGTVLSWNDVAVVGMCKITMAESSGPITVRFYQHVAMNGIVSVVARDTLGEIGLAFDLSGEVSAETVCIWDLGEPKVIDLGGFTGDPKSFQSSNHPAGSRFEAIANSTIGNIVVEGRWS